MAQAITIVQPPRVEIGADALARSTDFANR